MTVPAPVLPTGYATEINGAAALVVGFAHGFPRTPAPGSLVQPFVGADTSVMATGVIGAPLYALVSVEWATEVKTVDPETGAPTTRYAYGMLGVPTGTTWHLHPAVESAVLGGYVLAPDRRYGASVCGAEVPPRARGGVQAWGFSGPDGVPDRARVLDVAL